MKYVSTLSSFNNFNKKLIAKKCVGQQNKN
ncbi:hypothetical protein GGR21_001392 [Dysgonomonas hofstadii]|uniref:Uncharacterized protein n=1 Tax=Dysgonomonas hofstadii TaxID=637886 RepID=A0A840CLF3_9BACT|nr:hypothetical protein [Dysgonomonas hofstadii]